MLGGSHHVKINPLEEGAQRETDEKVGGGEERKTESP